jgi:hypothetical protein
MHGNPRYPRDDLNDRSMNAGAVLWLAWPGAREYFDPATLSAADQSRMARQGARRRSDFEVSRALRAFADAGETAHSLSHSAEHAALLIAPNSACRLGVDLETNKPRDVLRLARFAFSEQEVAQLEAATDQARAQRFYTLWTLKESFAKALQFELVDALRQCVFWEQDGTWHGQIPTDASWGAMVFAPRPQLFLAAAWVGQPELSVREQWEWPPRERGHWPLLAQLRST